MKNSNSHANATHLLPISARTPQAIIPIAQSYKAFLQAQDAPSLDDICYAASCRQPHYAHRLALTAADRAGMVEQLDAVLQNGPAVNQTHIKRQPKIAFVFSGYGSQWFGMGRQLMAQEPVFRQALATCEQAMRSFVDWSLHEQLTAEKDSPIYRLDKLDVLMPTLVAFEIALAVLWRSWGIEPDGVIGHSIGEVAASYITGVFSLEDAMRNICRQSELMQQASGPGGMAVVGISAAEAQEMLSGYEDRLVVSGEHSPRSSVLSGDAAALIQVVERLRQHNIFCSLIPIEMAAHSFHLEPFKTDLQTALADVQPQTGSVPIYSPTLNTVMDGSEQDAGFWVQNFRQPVLFAPMIQQMLADGFNVFIELSAHPILLYPVQEGVDYAGENGLVVSSLRRNRPERAAMLSALSSLYTHGCPVEWEQVYSDNGRFPIQLPAYLPEWDDLPELESQREKPQHSDICVRLLAVEPGKRRQTLLETYLREQVAQVLRLAPARIAVGKSFKELGLDSLTAVEFANHLQTNLGFTLPPTLVWNYATITALAPYLANKMGISLQAVNGQERYPVQPISVPAADDESLDDLLPELETDLDNVSMDEMELLLADELAAIDDLLKGD